MRITKALIEKLASSNLEAALKPLSKDDLAYIVKKANESYHRDGKPFISDTVFDYIKERLAALDPSAPEVNEVGAAPGAKTNKVTLPYYMGSMDKIKTDDRALANFVYKFTGKYVITDKLDGISALLHVKNGKVSLFTRGDGTVGQDITHLLSHIKGVPSTQALLKIAGNEELTVRGELIMTRLDFEKVKTRGANARNMVAGIVNAKRPDASIAKLIQFMAYTMIYPNNLASSAAYAFLQTKNFNVAHQIQLTQLRFEELSEILTKRRSQSPFEVDGIVVTHDAVHEHETGRNPSYAFAFKNVITQETAEVIVTNVEWNVSKDGYLVPVVEFEPVKLAGVMVKRATGFNGEFIHANSIGPGARILVTRSGDVIPYILQIIEPASRPQMPAEQFAWTETGKDIYLEDALNNEQVRLRQLENFFTKLNVPGMKAGTIVKLFNAGLDDLPKIISAKAATIAAIDGFHTKSAEKIVDAVKEKLSALSCVEFMDASNAFGRGFGSRRLTSIITAIPRIGDDVYTPSMAELLAVDGVSDKTAEAFLKGLHAYRLFKKNLGVKCKGPAAATTATTAAAASGSAPNAGKLIGQVVVFSGFRDAALKTVIESNGGEVGDTVTKKTTILVVKDLAKSTSKVEKAQKNGVVVYDLGQFKSHYKM